MSRDISSNNVKVHLQIIQIRKQLSIKEFHWVKKAISLKGKHKGNHMETTSLQQISMGFPSWKLPFSMWFPLEGKHPTLRFTCFHRMETRVN